jgi:hypothetical protein
MEDAAEEASCFLRRREKPENAEDVAEELAKANVEIQRLNAIIYRVVFLTD